MVKDFVEHVFEHDDARQTFDTLRAPIGRNVFRVPSPNFFGVAIEEHRIQFPAEAVDEKIFQRILVALEKQTLEVTAADFERFKQAEIFKRRGVELDRVIEKFPAKQNPRETIFLEQDAFAVGIFVGRHHAFPPRFDGSDFCVQVMRANVHTVAVVHDGFGNAADRVALFEDDDLKFVGELRQLVSRRQTCGSGTDYDCTLQVIAPFADKVSLCNLSKIRRPKHNPRPKFFRLRNFVAVESCA